MDTFPDFNMYAVLKNNIVISCGFGKSKLEIVDFLSKQLYNNSNGEFQFVQMTPDNSPAEIGMKYNGTNFTY
jgi:hypothetical protein